MGLRVWIKCFENHNTRVTTKNKNMSNDSVEKNNIKTNQKQKQYSINQLDTKT